MADKDDQKTDKQKCHDEIVAILAKYDYKESDIPLNHDYWKLVNKYRSL